MSDSLKASMMKRIGELKADVEHFKFILEEERQIAREDWAGLRAENARLKADVERITKAGDTIISILCKYVPRTGAKYALMDWKDAKEGKQP